MANTPNVTALRSLGDKMSVRTFVRDTCANFFGIMVDHNHDSNHKLGNDGQMRPTRANTNFRNFQEDEAPQRGGLMFIKRLPVL